MGALSPRAIAEMEPDLIALVDRLLETIAAKGKFELIGDFASAIPVQVIGNLLDVPMEQREPLRDWSLSILGALETGDIGGSFCPRQHGGEGFFWATWKYWSRGGGPNPAIPSATC